MPNLLQQLGRFVPGVKVQNNEIVSIIGIQINPPSSQLSVNQINRSERHLGIDYRAGNESDNFTIYLTNMTDQNIRYVLLHFEIITEDNRHRWHVRRPLYRPGSKSKNFGMTDHINADEREVEFHVNTDGEVPIDRSIEHTNWEEEHDTNWLVEWNVRQNGGRDRLIIAPYIAYKFQNSEELRESAGIVRELTFLHQLEKTGEGIWGPFENHVYWPGTDLTALEYDALQNSEAGAGGVHFVLMLDHIAGYG